MVLLKPPHLVQFQAHPDDAVMVIHSIHSLIVEGGKIYSGLLAEGKRLVL
jgi:hypothetical protein